MDCEIALCHLLQVINIIVNSVSIYNFLATGDRYTEKSGEKHK